MALLSLSKLMVQRSERVKSAEMHPVEPWVLCGLYSGKVVIYNYETGVVVKSFDVSDLPIRSARFISRKQWIVACSDDMYIRVFNYNTQERLAAFEAHNDYIRHLEIHPTQPYVISSSDDMTAKLWDWDKDWKCVATYEGHTHYIMMAKINPKDTNTFATASLDRTIKVWSLGSNIPNFSLEGHERGVNCLDYYPGGDKPYIISGSDDHTVRIWDYQTRSCVTEMTGHTNNLCSVLFHPRLPLILSASEDGTVKVWQNTSYRLETTLNYGFQRAWAIAATENSNKVALGFDDGTIVVSLAREVPVASMDTKTGRLVVARNNVIYSSSLRSTTLDDGEDAGDSPRDSADGERISLVERELGTMELFPQTLSHNSNGRFLAVCGNNEYVIYTSQALRNKSFGTALELVWSPHGAGDYAVIESSSKIRVFKNFKESHVLKPAVSAEGIFGGELLGVRSADALCFYDWDSDRLVRKIEVTASNAAWNDTGDLVAIYGDALYVLRFNRDVLVDSQPTSVHEGYEDAFELQHEVVDNVVSGVWISDCFVYTNASNRLNYYIGGEIITHAHLDKSLHILGYLARDGRVFLIDNSGAVVSYRLSLAVLEYQTAVVRRDFTTANEILPNVPREQYNNIAKFLESQGFKEYALQVADDFDLKFDLAIQLNKLDVAHKVLMDAMEDLRADGTDTDEMNNKWKQLLDLSLARSNIELAEECGLAAGDLGALLLIYTSTGDQEGLERLGRMAEDAGKANIAFLSYHSAGNVDGCVRALEKAGQTTEAEVFSLVYPKPESPESQESPVSQDVQDVSDDGHMEKVQKTVDEEETQETQEVQDVQDVQATVQETTEETADIVVPEIPEVTNVPEVVDIPPATEPDVHTEVRDLDEGQEKDEEVTVEPATETVDIEASADTPEVSIPDITSSLSSLPTTLDAERDTESLPSSKDMEGMQRESTNLGAIPVVQEESTAATDLSSQLDTLDPVGAYESPQQAQVLERQPGTNAPESVAEVDHDLILEDDWAPIDTSPAPVAGSSGISTHDIDADIDTWGSPPISTTNADAIGSVSLASSMKPAVEHTTPPLQRTPSPPATVSSVPSVGAPPQRLSFPMPTTSVASPGRGVGVESKDNVSLSGVSAPSTSATTGTATFQSPMASRPKGEFATPSRIGKSPSISSSVTRTPGEEFMSKTDVPASTMRFPLPGKTTTTSSKEEMEPAKTFNRLSASPIQDSEGDDGWDDI